MATRPRILWADDEIDLLRPHVLFLQSKGYDVETVTNGHDAAEEIRKAPFDVVLLDEQMPGMNGLDALAKIKEMRPEVPVIMVTKSEEEDLMEEALGGKISDYLTKPVNPSQILLTIKRLLERTRIRTERVSQDYMQRFNQITQALMQNPGFEEWVEIYRELVGYDTELEGDEGARQILEDQYREANRAFGRFVEDEYPHWIAGVDETPGVDRPLLSHEVISKSVFPHLGAVGSKPERPVVFFLIDCMRYDQWLEFERLLRPLYEVEKSFHYSLLPTATPYSRNAIFSGLLPRDIAKYHPDIWADIDDDERSKNRHEEELLQALLKRSHRTDTRLRYEKLITGEDGRSFASDAKRYAQHDLTAIVVNFVDILAHSRSDSDVLKELAPDERAYRALTRTWFEHSWLYQAFRDLAETGAKIVVTSDHGAVRSLHATKVIGDRDTSTALRYKVGRNLKCDERHAVLVKDPESYGLPSGPINTNYIIAKEDYYFVYPTNYHRYLNRYKDTMQHGGMALEEVILPVATLTPKG